MTLNSQWLPMTEVHFLLSIRHLGWSCFKRLGYEYPCIFFPGIQTGKAVDPQGKPWSWHMSGTCTVTCCLWMVDVLELSPFLFSVYSSILVSALSYSLPLHAPKWSACKLSKFSNSKKMFEVPLRKLQPPLFCRLPLPNTIITKQVENLVECFCLKRWTYKTFLS